LNPSLGCTTCKYGPYTVIYGQKSQIRYRIYGVPRIRRIYGHTVGPTLKMLYAVYGMHTLCLRKVYKMLYAIYGIHTLCLCKMLNVVCHIQSAYTVFTKCVYRTYALLYYHGHPFII